VSLEKKIWQENCREKLLLYVISSSESLRGSTHEAVVEKALSGGATAIQLRDKHLTTRELIKVGDNIRKLTRQYDALFLVNDRLDIALAVEADGVHLGQEDMPLWSCRELVGPDFIIGISARTVEQAREAEKGGADYLGSGPVYATSTKEDSGPVLGLQGLAEICHAVSLPVLGIGGIEAPQSGKVLQAGAAGVAVVSAVVSAEDPAEASREFRKVMAEEGKGDFG